MGPPAFSTTTVKIVPAPLGVRGASLAVSLLSSAHIAGDKAHDALSSSHVLLLLVPNHLIVSHQAKHTILTGHLQLLGDSLAGTPELFHATVLSKAITVSPVVLLCVLSSLLQSVIYGQFQLCSYDFKRKSRNFLQPHAWPSISFSISKNTFSIIVVTLTAYITGSHSILTFIAIWLPTFLLFHLWKT